METHKHKRLTLQLVNLASGDKWEGQRKELSFIFTRTGNGKAGLGSASRTLAPGDVLIVNGNSTVQLAPQAKAGMTFWTFFLSLDELIPLLTCREIVLLPALRENLGAWKYFSASALAAVECHKLLAGASPHFHLSHRSQLLSVVAVILDEEFKLATGSPDGRSPLEDHTLAVLENLSLEQMLDLPIGELAAQFGCSRRHLNRTFNQQFGMSVASVRLELRLLKAAALLRNPEAKVINVGLECGFNHAGLFNLCFKRRFACTPGKWREQEGSLKSPELAPAAVECTLRRVGLCPLGETSVASLAKVQAVNAIGHGGAVKALAGSGTIVNFKSGQPAARRAQGGNGT